MEEFIISDLTRVSGIINAAIVDNEGFLIHQAKENNEQSKNISKIADLVQTKDKFSRITVTSERAILIVEQLEIGHRLVIWCEHSCNLGMIRKSLENASQRLNEYIKNTK
jgi:predicted regulator of Ras-like GTPase activity (Roadblock/LC7/MglB family)